MYSFERDIPVVERFDSATDSAIAATVAAYSTSSAGLVTFEASESRLFPQFVVVKDDEHSTDPELEPTPSNFLCQSLPLES